MVDFAALCSAFFVTTSNFGRGSQCSTGGRLISKPPFVVDAGCWLVYCITKLAVLLCVFGLIDLRVRWYCRDRRKERINAFVWDRFASLHVWCNKVNIYFIWWLRRRMAPKVKNGSSSSDCSRFFSGRGTSRTSSSASLCTQETTGRQQSGRPITRKLLPVIISSTVFYGCVLRMWWYE